MRSTQLLQKGALYCSQISTPIIEDTKGLFKCARLKKAEEIWLSNVTGHLTLSCAWGASLWRTFGSTNKAGIRNIWLYCIMLVLIAVEFYKNTFLVGVLLCSPDSPPLPLKRQDYSHVAVHSSFIKECSYRDIHTDELHSKTQASLSYKILSQKQNKMRGTN